MGIGQRGTFAAADCELNGLLGDEKKLEQQKEL
jgi:hypothetical protein